MATGWKKEYTRYKTFYLNILESYKKRPVTKVYLELFLTLATITLFSLFALKPAILTIVELLNNIETKEETIAKMDTKIANLQQAQSIHTQELSRIALLDTAIPKNPSPDTFSQQIEGAAAIKNSGLMGISIESTKLVGSDEQRKAKKDEEVLPHGALGISMSLNFTGNYQSLYDLLSTLEFMRRPIKIMTLNFTRPSTDLFGPDILNLSISGQAPYLKSNNNEKS